VALHNLCCGITTVMPPVDLRAPASADGALVLDEVIASRVTRLSGAPAYLDRLVDHMERSGRRAPTVRLVAVGGAPVPRPLCARIRKVFPDATCTVVYGSTEAEPMTQVSMDEILAAEDPGFLVGRPARSATLHLVNLPDPPPRLGPEGVDPFRVPPGEAGEVLVSGPHVIARYLDNPEADRENKLYAPDGRIWHRTGDVGHRDAQDRLWLTGRRADMVRHRGRLLHPLLLEARLDPLPGVRRSALLAWEGAPEGAVLIALAPGAAREETVARVREALRAAGLAELPLHLVPEIPVDSRHNSKVDRPGLRRRVRGRTGRGSG
jgi:acyl-CoA synthetase (AMP-forming)/AMP-acid ligase II